MARNSIDHSQHPELFVESRRLDKVRQVDIARNFGSYLNIRRNGDTSP
jgi:hypothetical protein